MAYQKKVILTFQQGASAEAKKKVVDDLKSKGATITKDENMNSSIMPFIVAEMPESHFDTLRSDSLAGHDVLKHVEEDGEMHILNK